jgi:hypothetical protein
MPCVQKANNCHALQKQENRKPHHHGDAPSFTLQSCPSSKASCAPSCSLSKPLTQNHMSTAWLLLMRHRMQRIAPTTSAKKHWMCLAFVLVVLLRSMSGHQLAIVSGLENNLKRPARRSRQSGIFRMAVGIPTSTKATAR